jgi:2-polyprenyl-6-methoxyphenol hydroxylase-like FAD-dependent oxidoreductase
VGIDSVVYERANELREVGAGMMLWPNATRVLRALGVLDRVMERSGPNDFFLVRSSDGRTLMNIALGNFDVPALCTRRSDLLAAMLDGVQTRLGKELVGIEQLPDRVRVHFADGSCAEHEAVIGADGIRSCVRAEVCGTVAPVYRGYMVWRGVARCSRAAMPVGSNSESWGHGHRFGILNTGGDRFTWYATANVDESHVDAQDGRKAELLRIFREWHEPVPQLVEATSEILKNGAYDLPRLKRWGRGRVTLLGDAAHSCTPNLGQGGCMALEDAFVLAKCLREFGIEAGLRRYERLRRSRTRHVQKRSLWMGKIGQWDSRVVVAGREMVTSMLPAQIFEFNLRRLYAYQA